MHDSASPASAHPQEEPAAAMLTVAVSPGRFGRVLVLSGESDATITGELDQFLASQLSAGTAHLTIDMSGLRFADSATIQVLLRTARTLKDRGGTMILLRPHPNVARVLTLTGADSVMTIRGQASR